MCWADVGDNEKTNDPATSERSREESERWREQAEAARQRLNGVGAKQKKLARILKNHGRSKTCSDGEGTNSPECEKTERATEESRAFAEQARGATEVARREVEAVRQASQEAKACAIDAPLRPTVLRTRPANRGGSWPNASADVVSSAVLKSRRATSLLPICLRIQK